MASFTSVAIAAHVTAQARLHLYNFLEVLQDRALYCDTDSVFFLDGPNDVKLETGDFLGQLTDELDAWPGSRLDEFVCGKRNCNILSTKIFIFSIHSDFVLKEISRCYRRTKKLCNENS